MSRLAKLPLLKIDLGEAQRSKSQDISNKTEFPTQSEVDHHEESSEKELSRVNIIKMLSGVILYNGYGLLKSVSLNNFA